ncbi:hypothetical protein P1X14_18585 [Sphingomonas sp. AOB5]|uniref:hypothetical protein n=1 Tax=Sphingomonas sp. AOB5 TaxID=3034017 RepID=UPI0023F71538|nr:hypothetical protein [Sphingomonas sp. AOB5]MDF7777274.1 hypothetical protein [Sphingomonas sp. AOB5]
MKWAMVAAAALLVAGCEKVVESHSVSAVLTADIAAGKIKLTCRASSTGNCHVLLVTGETIERMSAAAGQSSEATGVTDATQYCLQENAPQNGCRLRKLVQGEQIVRSESKHVVE